MKNPRTRNYALAMRCYDSACRQGHIAFGCVSAGDLCERGLGCPRKKGASPLDIAYAWYQTSCYTPDGVQKEIALACKLAATMGIKLADSKKGCAPSRKPWPKPSS